MSKDTDKTFTELMESLDLEPPAGMVSVAILSDVDLSSRFGKIKQELLERGEMINPTTQTGRDLHSERAAYLIEMRRRGMV